MLRCARHDNKMLRVTGALKGDRKSTRLNSSHLVISYAVFCLKKKTVYSFASPYTDTGQIAIYLGTRADNLADALGIAAAQIADVAADNLPAAELARAKENLTR